MSFVFVNNWVKNKLAHLPTEEGSLLQQQLELESDVDTLEQVQLKQLYV